MILNYLVKLKSIFLNEKRFFINKIFLKNLD